MAPALTYLWFVLLKRSALRFFRKLRHPSTAIGFAALLFAFGMLFHFRHESFFRQMVRSETLIGCAFIMLCGSIFKGFLQRGLVFELADIEFLFTGPFRRAHLIIYRLLPGYLYSIAQAAVFIALFAPHLKRPILMLFCLTLFQIVCFHISAGAAIYGGKISVRAHDRIRWMLVGCYGLATLFYLRAAWGLKLIPGFFGRPEAELLFYPDINPASLANAPWVRQWTEQLVTGRATRADALFETSFYLLLFCLAALASLALLLRLKGDLFEVSLVSTTRSVERRSRLQQGSSLAAPVAAGSFPLPQHTWFQGVRAILWKNLVVARRSRRELLMAAALTLIYTGFLVALRWTLRHY